MENDLFDLFSKVVWPLKEQRPSLSGFMQMCTQQRITWPRKDNNYIPSNDRHEPQWPYLQNSTLQKSNKYGVTPVLTNDQPVYQKATQIVIWSVKSTEEDCSTTWCISHTDGFSLHNWTHHVRFWSWRNTPSSICSKCCYAYDVRKGGFPCYKRSLSWKFCPTCTVDIDRLTHLTTMYEQLEEKKINRKDIIMQ